MRSAFGCAALGLLLLLVAGTFDAEPLYVTGSALALLGLGAAGWIARRRVGREIERELGTPQRARGAAAGGRDHRRAPARCRCRRAGSTSRCCPSPCASRPAAARTRVRVEIRFGRRGRRRLAPPALVLRDPFGLAQRVVRGEHEDEILVLPRTFPVNVTAAGGEATPAHARAALIAAAETEIDGAAPVPRGLARLAHPLAVGGARRTG